MNVNAKKLTNPIQVEELHKFIQKGKANDHNIIKKEHGVCKYILVNMHILNNCADLIPAAEV